MNNIGSYISRDSIIHLLHPLTKNALFISVFAICLLTNNPIILSAIFICVIGVGCLAKLPIYDSMRTLKSAAALIILFSVIIWPVSLTEGTILMELFGIKIYSVGLYYGIAMSFRFCSIVLMSIYWMMFTSISEITYGLTRMGVPYKVAFSFSMSLRFVPLIIKDLNTIKDAQRSRALEMDKGSLMNKIIKNVTILVPLSSRALGLINQIAVSLEARGFEIVGKRTSINEQPLITLDYVLIIGTGFAIIILAAMRAMQIALITTTVL